jgi:hypothetical protein
MTVNDTGGYTNPILSTEIKRNSESSGQFCTQGLILAILDCAFQLPRSSRLWKIGARPLGKPQCSLFLVS